MLKSGSSWNLVPLPASSTKGGVKGRAESSGIRLGRGTNLLNYLILHQNQPTSWLVHTRNTLGVGTNHRQPWTHLTHHGPNSRKATTFPHIVFYALLCRTYIRVALFPWTPKVESRNYVSYDSRYFGRS